ncbi:DUF4386 domain-containing protein [Kribbia dieselivorans]|uniref:DUF4386 domain-containing protein n=1 Tax=Kribbia dieselivorans TaxID=331526 RepID=UPI000838B3E8|nr:DUF4386 domain-containing protein [Kribbia dieselivorans]
MDRPQTHARLAGGLYLVTVITSIPALALKDPVLGDPTSLATAGAITDLRWAALLEVVLALACIGTAVALYPIVARAGQAPAIGFVAARTLEAGLVMTGVIAMLSLIEVPVGSAAAPTLVAIHDWAFLIGPGLVPAVNALLLAPALLRLRAVPRVLPIIGLIGAPLLLISALATLMGAMPQVSLLAGAAALPIAAWEIGLGIWLLIKGVHLAPRPAEAPPADTPIGAYPAV